jgi:peptidoglycan hydrolase-like protein with peptidoglycan-binding domain
VTTTHASEPRRQGRSESPATYTRRRALVAAALGGVPAMAWLTARAGGPDSSTDAGRPGGAPPPTARPATTTSTTTPPVTTIDPDDAETLGPITRDLALGMVNGDVRALQQRLHELHFDPGPVDGWFGEATLRSVWAFEKLILGVPRVEATGVVTPTTWDRMRGPLEIAPRRSTNAQADHTEIYLPEQILAVFHRDQPVLISHMSSGELDENGDPAEWCELVTIDTDERGNPLEEPVERDICGRSKTPPGVFDYYRRVEGIRNAALGSMWNPVYFNYGIAVHGALNVPLAPASHGCVRIPMHISDYFQDLVNNGDRVLVWDGRRQPEDVSEQDMLPVFDYANPDATTTTTSSTTTTTTTAPQPVGA